MQNIVGMFEDRDEAENAIERLRSLGIRADSISIAMKDVAGEPSLAESTGAHDLAEEGAGVGAVSGAAIGTMVGLLVAGSTFVLPGVGTFLIAGPLAAALTGAGVGAASGGVFGALVGSGIPEPEATHYLEGVQAGRVILAVQVEDGLASEVSRIFDEEGSRRTLGFCFEGMLTGGGGICPGHPSNASLSDRVPVDDGDPKTLVFGEVNISFDFEIIIRQGQWQPFVQADLFFSEVSDRPGAVQPEPALGVGVVEVGVDGRSQHRLIPLGSAGGTSWVGDCGREQLAHLIRRQSGQCCMIGAPTGGRNDITAPLPHLAHGCHADLTMRNHGRELKDRGSVLAFDRDSRHAARMGCHGPLDVFNPVSAATNHKGIIGQFFHDILTLRKLRYQTRAACGAPGRRTSSTT